MEYFAYLLFALCSPPTVHTFNPCDTLAMEKTASIVQPIDGSIDNSNFNSAEIARFIFEDSLKSLYERIGLKNYNLSYDVFRFGMIGYYSLRQQGKLGGKNILSIIDFTKSSCQKRFYTIDLDEFKVKFFTYVSHGKNTGEDMAKSFSNILHSNQSSLGFYVTAETYIGTKGYSLKLDGVERGINDNMRERAVVMHEADYVSENWIKRNGRLGRSQGCPALPKEISKAIINTIKNQTTIFAYFKDNSYLQNSAFLNLDRMLLQNDLFARLTP